MGPFILICLVLTALALASRYWLQDSGAGGRRRLRRDFKRLRKSVLKRSSRVRRDEIRGLLDQCEGYLESLSSAQYEHDVIHNLIANAERLSGAEVQHVRERTARVQLEIGRRLADLFAALSRLSATAGLGMDDAVGELHRLTSTFEIEHDAFVQLTRELESNELVVRQEAS